LRVADYNATTDAAADVSWRTSFGDLASTLAGQAGMLRSYSAHSRCRLKLELNTPPTFAVLKAAERDLSKGMRGIAIRRFDRIASDYPEWKDGSFLRLNTLCRWGGLSDHALPAMNDCDRAASLAPIASVLQSRAIAEAGLQKWTDSARDLDLAIHLSKDDKAKAQLMEWRETIRKRQNPFTTGSALSVLADDQPSLDDYADQVAAAALKALADGNMRRGVDILRQADSAGLQSNKEVGTTWSYFCLYGSLNARPFDGDVLELCEQAERRKPGDSAALIGRGITRARLGDVRGALDDLSRQVSASLALPAASHIEPLRMDWVRRLRRHDRPFSDSALAGIRKRLPSSQPEDFADLLQGAQDLPDLEQIQQDRIEQIERERLLDLERYRLSRRRRS
jgi:hypothetical protein